MLEYLVILFISPLIFLFFFTVPQYIWSLFQKPKLDAQVNKLYEKSPEISLVEKMHETEILVKNFRNAKYKSSEWDNEVLWENKKFNFEDLNNLEVLVDHYALFQSHIVLIFNFIDEHRVCKRLCVSYEPKKKDPLDFHVSQAIYRNFEAGYIVGSYEDLVGVRYMRYVNFTSSKDIFTPSFKNLNIYKLNFTKTECQTIFKSLMVDINIYSKKAFFYNFIYRNCLSEILKHFRTTGRFDYSFLNLLFLNKIFIRNDIIK